MFSKTSSQNTGNCLRVSQESFVVRFGFEDLGLADLELPIAVDNMASRRAAEKVGAVHEGILRRCLRQRSCSGSDAQCARRPVLPFDMAALTMAPVIASRKT